VAPISLADFCDSLEMSQLASCCSDNPAAKFVVAVTTLEDSVVTVDLFVVTVLPLTDTLTSRRLGSGVARLRQEFGGRRSISGRRSDKFSAKPWPMLLLGQRSAAGGGGTGLAPS
jgi:hypothetical protein